MSTLSNENRSEKLQEDVKKLNDWKYISSVLKKEFNFKSYSEAVLFTNMLAYLAEKRDHHPDILLKYNFVSVSLSTHDAGDITDKDIKFAEEVDRLT